MATVCAVWWHFLLTSKLWRPMIQYRGGHTAGPHTMARWDRGYWIRSFCLGWKELLFNIYHTFNNPSASTAVFVPGMQVILPCKNREKCSYYGRNQKSQSTIGQIPPHSPGADLHTFTFVCLRWLFTDSTTVNHQFCTIVWGICLIFLQPP